MIKAQLQVHGYRKGHQLLASSSALSKEDQATIDRLSDMAGPLRPKESFKAYISAYPLPSGDYYVVGRTWQDLAVSRAGCVRTLSVLIPMKEWMDDPPLASTLRLLGSVVMPDEKLVQPVLLEPSSEVPFAPTSNFSSGELVEALFLEDPKPIVVFDAPEPETISVRLLAALWPELRCRFALSTFALSPRRVGGRDFDLVFAPMNAKSKFSDWPGRRVDGRVSTSDRHRWTSAIASRVFEAPIPKLLDEREVELIGRHGAETPASLRIALLWDELLTKLDRLPTAALGLLDIANSGMVSRESAMKVLEPRLVSAMQQAAEELAPVDAWEFFGAISRKTYGDSLPAAEHAMGEIASQMAKRSPEGAIDVLSQPDPRGAIGRFAADIAQGMIVGDAVAFDEALTDAPEHIVARLAAMSSEIARRVARKPQLIEKAASAFVDLDTDQATQLVSRICPFLVQDWQMPLAAVVFDKLEADDIGEALRRIGIDNNFEAQGLSKRLIGRARSLRALPIARAALISAQRSLHRDALLRTTLSPVVSDLLWLMDERLLTDDSSRALAIDLLQEATDKQLAKIVSSSRLMRRILERLSEEAAPILAGVLVNDSLAMDAYLCATRELLPWIARTGQTDIAQHALNRCLRVRFEGDDALLSTLLEILGSKLDGPRVVRLGLERDVEVSTASRNLLAFDQAFLPAREQILCAIDVLGRTLHGRHKFDFPEWANAACANLLTDSQNIASGALMDAAGWLVPPLLQERRQPVSLLIAAVFPVLYRELVKNNSGPDVFTLVPFLRWDKTKSARQDLVYAFMSSNWRPGDLALTACRCNDAQRILSRVARSFHGADYLMLIEHDLDRLSDSDRSSVLRALARIRGAKFHDLDS